MTDKMTESIQLFDHRASMPIGHRRVHRATLQMYQVVTETHQIQFLMSDVSSFSER
jgi:hypothetical protein